MQHPALLAIATCATLWLGVSRALAGGRTLTICTPSLVPDVNGRLSCTVVATSRSPIDMTAHLLGENGTDVTEFGTGYRAGPEVTGDGYQAEETAGSFADDARYCRATIDDVPLKKAVRVTLTAFDADGNVTASLDSSETRFFLRKDGRCAPFPRGQMHDRERAYRVR